MTTALPDFQLVSITDIDLGTRYREHPETDLETLVESIRSLGHLLHPIVIMPSENGSQPYRLVAGQRRMLACQEIGYTAIEAHVIEDLDQLQAEEGREHVPPGDDHRGGGCAVRGAIPPGTRGSQGSQRGCRKGEPGPEWERFPLSE